MGDELRGARALKARLRIVSRYPERMGLQDLLVEIKREVEQFSARARGDRQRDGADAQRPSPRVSRVRRRPIRLLQKPRVATLMTTTLLTLLGGETATGVALSTVADSIVALRYLELEGELRRGILMVKLRGQAHDRTIHEYEITDNGIRLLGSLHGVAGILTGRASFLGDAQPTTPVGSESSEPGGV